MRFLKRQTCQSIITELTQRSSKDDDLGILTSLSGPVVLLKCSPLPHLLSSSRPTERLREFRQFRATERGHDSRRHPGRGLSVDTSARWPASSTADILAVMSSGDESSSIGVLRRLRHTCHCGRATHSLDSPISNRSLIRRMPLSMNSCNKLWSRRHP